MPDDGPSDEFQRSRAERRRLRELDQRMRIENEAAVRLVLDEFHPAGVPDELVERICRIQNLLIKEIISLEKVTRELHDGINRIGDEAAQRWVSGFRECIDQVRERAAEEGLPVPLVGRLLRNDVRDAGTSREDNDRAASQQVEWSRG